MKKSLTTLVIGTVAATALLGACSDDKKSSTADYCARIAKFKSDADSFNMDFGTATPEELKAGFTAMAAALRSMEDGAPAAIAADVKLEADATDQMIAIFEAYQWDGNATMSETDNQKLSDLMTDPALSTANDNLKQYEADVCGVSPTTTTGA